MKTLPMGFVNRFDKWSDRKGEIKNKDFALLMGWFCHLMRRGRLQKEQFGIQVEILSETLNNWVRK